MINYRKLTEKRMHNSFSELNYLQLSKDYSVLFASAPIFKLYPNIYENIKEKFDQNSLNEFKNICDKIPEETRKLLDFDFFGKKYKTLVFKSNECINIFLINDDENFLDNYAKTIEMLSLLNLQATFDLMDIPIVATEDNSIKYANPALANSLGLRMSVLHSTTLSSIMDLKGQNNFAKVEEAIKNSEPAPTLELTFKNQQEQLFITNVHTAPYFIENGEKVMINVLSDVTESEMKKKLLELYSGILSNVEDAVLITDTNCNLIYCNDSFTFLTGYNLDDSELITELITSFEDGGKTFLKTVVPKIQNGEAAIEFGYFETKNKIAFPAEITIKRLFSEFYMFAVKNVSARLEMEKLIYRYKNVDYLTGMANSEFFINKLVEKLDSFKENGGKLGLMTFEVINYIELFNSYGPEIANIVLKMVALRAKSYVGEIEEIARIGESRFGLFFNANNEEEMKNFIDGFMDIMDWPLVYENCDFPVVVSVGAGIYPDNAVSPIELYGFVRDLMRRARREKRSGYAIHTMKHGIQVVLHKNSLEVDIDRAFKNDEFKIYYQAIADTKTDETVGYEALMRWESPTFGTLMPGAFLRLAENTKLIIPIGYSMLEKILEYARNLKNNQFITINLTANQILDPDLPKTFFALCEKYNADCSKIQFEFPAINIGVNTKKIHEAVANLVEKGLNICIDNFGIGFSTVDRINLSGIKRITLDRGILKNITTDRNARNKVGQIILIAKENGVSTIANGIEETEQLDILKKFCCDMYSGYLFDKPKSLN